MAEPQVAQATQEQEISGKKQKGVIGSGSGRDGNESRSSKMVKIDEFSAPKTVMSVKEVVVSPLLSRSNSSEQMLSFKSDVSVPSKQATVVAGAAAAPSYYHHSPAFYTRNAGYGFNSNMHGAFIGIRGPFTPSQWIELEHQALIYKYINANVAIPSNLLFPIKKSFYPFGLSGSSGGSLPPHSLAWNSFHYGYASNTDPEPGRCRRTDGKKWRCSRDAVLDQKYCERHINRGRHRSRKPVEGQSGHAVSGTNNPKVAPRPPSTPIASVVSSGSASNNTGIAPGIAQSQFNSLIPSAKNPSIGTIVNSSQDQPCGSILSPSVNLNSNEDLFSIGKHNVAFDEPSQSDFGQVSSDSLLNPLQKSSYMNSKNYSSFMDFNDQESQDANQLRQFTENWPKEQSDSTAISWSDEMKSDWTQLSMATIPMTSSGFSSSASSPAHEKLVHSPLKVTHEYDPFQMGFEKNCYSSSERSEKQMNWTPAVHWGSSSSSSMGGPLGEVLNNTNCTLEKHKNSSSINLMNLGWNGSSQMESSPTGVLQKMNFGSLSNSSTSGSSPRGENMRSHERGSLCNGVFTSSMASSSSIPLM